MRGFASRQGEVLGGFALALRAHFLVLGGKKVKKVTYKKPEFLIVSVNIEDVIKTSNQPSEEYPSDNDWKTDIGDWDIEM